MRVFYKKRFEKKFKKLPRKIKEQFYFRLEMFSENKTKAILNNHAVDAAYQGCRSINITGDYRAVFQDNDDVVTFILIGTHSELY